MTIDERIEALTQSVELLASMHKDLEVMHAELERKLNQGFELIGGTLQLLGASMVKMAQIAENHEFRLKGLEAKK